MTTAVDSPPENAVEMMAMAGAGRFRLDQYHTMFSAKIFREPGEVELIEGYLFDRTRGGE